MLPGDGIQPNYLLPAMKPSRGDLVLTSLHVRPAVLATEGPIYVEYINQYLSRSQKLPMIFFHWHSLNMLILCRYFYQRFIRRRLCSRSKIFEV